VTDSDALIINPIWCSESRRTCLVAAANTQDDFFVENDFLGFHEIAWVTTFSRILYTEIEKYSNRLIFD